MRVGSQDVLLPTTMVGNYPNPRWYDGRAFATYPKGEFVYDAISREAFEDAVGAIVHDQEAAGLDVISDGKVYGGDSPYGQILYHYVERMTGFKLTGPPIGLPIYSTLFAPTCVGEVRREHPFHLATLRAVRRATRKPVKVSYTGIQVLAAATNNQHYKETKELALAIAKAFNEDFKELADNGCDIVQLDEFVWPYGMGDWEVEALNTAVEGAGCQFWGTPVGATTRERRATSRTRRSGSSAPGCSITGRPRPRHPNGPRRSSPRCSTPTSTRSTTRSVAPDPTTSSRCSSTSGRRTSPPVSST